jgi:IS6 family transposase
MVKSKSFKWRHYEPDVILWCVRWYLQTALTYRQIKSMLAERGLPIVHTTIMRKHLNLWHQMAILNSCCLT